MRNAERLENGSMYCKNQKEPSWGRYSHSFIGKSMKARHIVLILNRSDLSHDRMTECHYAEPLTTFETEIVPEPVYDVDHREGRLSFPDKTILDNLKQEGLTLLLYVDDNGDSTEKYPCNPNGSTDGLAGPCSSDGSHLALMPHPLRAFLPGSAINLPKEMKDLQVAPWIRLLRNAYEWCRIADERRD